MSVGMILLTVLVLALAGFYLLGPTATVGATVQPVDLGPSSLW